MDYTHPREGMRQPDDRNFAEAGNAKTFLPPTSLTATEGVRAMRDEDNRISDANLTRRMTYLAALPPRLPRGLTLTSPLQWGSGEADLPPLGEGPGEEGSEGTLLAAMLTRTSLPPSPAGYKLTGVDEEWLTWLLRVRYATSLQLLTRFGVPGALEEYPVGDPRRDALRQHYKAAGVPTTEAGVRWRLNRLRNDGLLAYVPTSKFEYGFWVPTKKTRILLGSVLSVPQVSDALQRHTHGLVDIISAYEADGYLVGTEAELKAADKGALDDRLGRRTRLADVQVPLPLRSKKRAKYETDVRDSHLPDCYVWETTEDGGVELPTAVELEISPKDTAVLTRTMVGYRDAIMAGRLANVVWFVTQRRVGQQIRDAAESLGMTSDQVQVHRYR